MHMNAVFLKPLEKTKDYNKTYSGFILYNTIFFFVSAWRKSSTRAKKTLRSSVRKQHSKNKVRIIRIPLNA